MAYERELAAAIDAVRTASNLCRSVQHNLIAADTVTKNDRSPVTVADLGTQAVVTRILRQTCPDDALVGEEDTGQLRENAELRAKVFELVGEQLAGISEAEMLDAIDFGNRDTDFTGRYWTLDPIDGTKGFLRGDQYAIALGLVENGQVTVGVLGCPNYPLDPSDPEARGALFYAVRGEGSWELPLAGGEARRITTDGKADGAEARFCESVEAAHADHDAHAAISREVGITQPPYRIDSQCKYAATARGDASIYLRLPRTPEYREKIWDHAAGVIVVEEAGGRVSDFSGKPLNFALGRKLKENVGIIATNGPLHEAALAAIRTVTG